MCLIGSVYAAQGGLMLGPNSLMPSGGILKNSEGVLKNIEVLSSDFSTQAIFFFSGACTPKKKDLTSDSRLCIFFPTLKLGNINQQDILKKLNKFNLIERFKFENVGSPKGVLLDIKFSEGAFVKLLHMEGKNKFIMEIYSKNELAKIDRSTGLPLYFAYNDLKKKRDAKLRVMIDPGHGGKALGTQGLYNLIEKDVNLDISKKVRFLLEKLGYEVALTRTRDEDISLVERSRKAEVFKANLFISIHANSSGGSDKAHGIETFHFNVKPFLGFLSDGAAVSYELLFIRNSEDHRLASVANNLVRSSESSSHKFADSIQNTLVDMLKKKNVAVINRGTKNACFLVLLCFLNKKIPSALVETGFITNKEEAKRLTDNNYRMLIAQGISKGVWNFASLFREV